MFKKYILNWLLPKLLAKKAPTRIPRSGEAGKSVNCFVIYIGSNESKPEYLVDSYDQDTKIIGVLSLDDSGTYAVKKTIELSAALKLSVSITQFYGFYEMRYINLYDLLFNRITRYDECRAQLRKLRNGISQSHFNKKQLVTKNSIELLSFMVSEQLDGDVQTNSWSTSTNGIDVISLMTQLYSMRWVSHPHSNQQMKKLELYLGSLVEAGDLKIKDSKYYVTGKALKTLEHYEENERRHKDSVGIQKKIFWLTIIIALTAMIQAKLITLPPLLEWPSYIKKQMEFYRIIYQWD